MSEQSRPKPFPEARPPHLPDVLTRQSPWILFFAALAVLQVWRSVQLLPPVASGTDVGLVTNEVLSWIAHLAPTVFALALFWRHPDARRTMPLLVFGLLLFALGELFDAFAEPIGTFLDGLVPPSDTDLLTGTETAARFAFRLFTSLIAVFALLYVGAGLSAARSNDRRTVERPLAVWLGALALISTVISFISLTGLPAEMTPMFVLQVVIGAILSALVTLGWAYIAVVIVGGWIAGERPKRAWAVGAIGASALFALRLLFPVFSLVPFDPQAVPLYLILAGVSYVGWLLLAAAFVLGLPTREMTNERTEPTVDPPAATQPGSAAG